MNINFLISFQPVLPSTWRSFFSDSLMNVKNYLKTPVDNEWTFYWECLNLFFLYSVSFFIVKILFLINFIFIIHLNEFSEQQQLYCNSYRHYNKGSLPHFFN